MTKDHFQKQAIPSIRCIATTHAIEFHLQGSTVPQDVYLSALAIHDKGLADKIRAWEDARRAVLAHMMDREAF